MEISFQAVGQLCAYFGSEQMQIEMDAGARIADFLLLLNERWGDYLPDYFWDNKRNDIRGPVLLIINGTVQLNRMVSLCEGDIIQLRKVLVGG